MSADNPALIGRDESRDELEAAFAEGARLVTLTGPGGIGKTTLSRAFAESQGGRFVDLTEAITEEGVYTRMAIALEIPLTGNEPPAELLAAALDEAALLVLDNCEQAIEPIAAVARGLLEARADVSLLATSREPLGIEGEQALPLPLLDDDSAVALLEARGRAAREGFSLGDQRELAVEIVRQLDRLPLAIELAAARLEVMTLEQLAARLQDQLRLLKRVGAPAEGPAARHATVRAAIQWSWDLLDEDARKTLTQCAVFKDGFTLEAVEAVVETEGWADDALQELKRKSLLLTEPTDLGLRFRLLESVRAFAHEKLLESDHEPRTVERFVAWFAPARDAGRPWMKLDAAGCAHLRAEVENLLAAMRAALDRAPRDPAAAVRAALELDRFFGAEGPVPNHFIVLDEAVAAAEEHGDPELLARALTARGEAHRRRAQPKKSQADFERARDLIPAGADALRAENDLRFALLHMVLGDFAQSEAFAQKVVDSAEGADARTTGLAYGLFGSLKLYFGDIDEAARNLERSLPYLRDAEDDRSLGLTLANLGVILMDRGEHEKASARFDEGAALFEGIRDGFNLATVHINRALSLLDQGKPGEALPLLDETAALCRRVGHRRLASYAKMCRGIAAHLQGDLETARAHFSDAIARAEQARESATLAASHAHLGLVRARLHESGEDDLARAAELAEKTPIRWVVGVVEVCRALAAGQPVPEGELGVVPTQIRLARALAEPGTGGVTSRGTLVIGPDARWLELPGTPDRQDLSRRGPLRRILVALADAHRKDALDVNQLIEAGWPGEKMHAESGAARVYAAVRTLRKLGLEPWLVTRDDGYLLDPEVDVERVS